MTEHIIASIVNRSRPETANPWHIIWKGEPHTIASDASRILLVKGHLPEGVADRKSTGGLVAHKATSEGIIQVFMNNEASEFQHVATSTSAQLLECGGKPAGHCDSCGEVCVACKDLATHYINYHGVPFNGLWIKEIMQGLPLGEIQLSLINKTLRLEGKDWIYLQMGMNFSEGKIALMPKLEDFLA